MQDRIITVSTSWNMKDRFKCTKSGHDRIGEINATFMKALRGLMLKAGGSEYVFH